MNSVRGVRLFTLVERGSNSTINERFSSLDFEPQFLSSGTGLGI